METDRFCGVCGKAQATTGTPPPFPNQKPTNDPNDFLRGITPRSASLLCYIPWVGWLAAIVVLASQRFRRDFAVRFHAFQGLYLFVAWLIVDWVFSPILSFSRFGSGLLLPRPLGGLLHLLILGAWVFMIIKTAHSEMYRLPIIGDLAQRSVDEQRN